MQVRLYYPNVEKKLAVIFEQNYQLWKSAIQKAKENGEIRQDLDVEETASMFWQMFFGTSFEEILFSRVGYPKTITKPALSLLSVESLKFRFLTM